jgi:hypothetical protein
MEHRTTTDLRVLATAAKGEMIGERQIYHASYRILDEQGEVVETFLGTVPFDSVASAFKEASALGTERKRAIAEAFGALEG